ncbi:hypothetical protein FRC12_019966 [Ceratobasidium sp. 428]|nr:hypothetical protein FRC12_019966 [Ceratobasidium sp. 428]
MSGSSLFDEWVRDRPKHEATALVEHLIKLVGADVCALRKNTQVSYRFVDTARSLCDSINGLIERVQEHADWDAFEKYANAIDPLEVALRDFTTDEDLDEGCYLSNPSKIEACLAHINRWAKARSDIRGHLRHLRTQKELSVLLESTPEDDKDVEDAHRHDDRTFLSDLVVATKSYLSKKENTTTFPRKIQAILHEVSKGIERVEKLINEPTTSQPIDDDSIVLAIKGVMTIYSFMELSLSQEVPRATRVYLKSEKVWLPAKQLVDGLIKHIKNEETYDEVLPVYQEFFDLLSVGPDVIGGAVAKYIIQMQKSAELGLPASYSALLKLVGQIGRSYHAQSILLVTLCREAATQYQKAEEKGEKQYVALENAFDQTLNALSTVAETPRPSVSGAGPAQPKTFELEKYDEQPCLKGFKDAAKELTSCFKELGLEQQEASETKLEAAMKRDKDRMSVTNDRFNKVKPVEATDLVKVTLKVWEGKSKGTAVGERIVSIAPYTRLSAIGWRVSKDPTFEDKVKGKKLLFEQVSGASATTKLVTLDATIGSLAQDAVCTLNAIISADA